MLVLKETGSLVSKRLHWLKAPCAFVVCRHANHYGNEAPSLAVRCYCTWHLDEGAIQTVPVCGLTWIWPLVIFLFCSSICLLVSCTNREATLFPSTLARGLEDGALNNVLIVGRNASSNISWLSLKKNKRQQVVHIKIHSQE